MDFSLKYDSKYTWTLSIPPSFLAYRGRIIHAERLSFHLMVKVYSCRPMTTTVRESASLMTTRTSWPWMGTLTSTPPLLSCWSIGSGCMRMLVRPVEGSIPQEWVRELRVSGTLILLTPAPGCSLEAQLSCTNAWLIYLWRMNVQVQV